MADREELSREAEEAAAPFREIISNAGVAAARAGVARSVFGGAPAAAPPASAGIPASVPVTQALSGTPATPIASTVLNPGQAPGMSQAYSQGLANAFSAEGALGIAKPILSGLGFVYGGAQIGTQLGKALMGKTDVDALQAAARSEFESLPKHNIQGPGFNIVAGTDNSTYVQVTDPAAFSDFMRLIQIGGGGVPTPIPVAEGDRGVLNIGGDVFRVTLPPVEIAKNFENFATVENNLRAGSAMLSNTPMDQRLALLEQALNNPGLSEVLGTPSLSQAILGQGQSGTPTTEADINQGLQDVIDLRTVNPLILSPQSISYQLGNQIKSPAGLNVTSVTQGPGDPTMAVVTAGSPDISGHQKATIPAETIGQTINPTTAPNYSGHRNIYI